MSPSPPPVSNKPPRVGDRQQHTGTDGPHSLSLHHSLIDIKQRQSEKLPNLYRLNNPW